MNELITEQGLAKRYGVSRTPIHEAMVRLSWEGLLDKYPKKGYLVHATTDSNLELLIQSLFFVESAVIDCVIDSVSDEQIRSLLHYTVEELEELKPLSLLRRGQMFYVRMVRLTGNWYMTNMVNSFSYLVSHPVSLSAQLGRENQRIMAFREVDYIDPLHRELVDALLARNNARAKEILAEDIGYPRKN